MSDKVKKDYLENLAELDTGKAQPLFHPYPVINIFREDETTEEKQLKEKPEDETLLTGFKGIVCDASETVKPQITCNLESEGAGFLGDDDIFSDNPKSPDFMIAMDAASTELYEEAKKINRDGYYFWKTDDFKNRDEMIRYWEDLTKKYSLVCQIQLKEKIFCKK